tara:strand:+ start:81 stop:470 length:390 start_codon:yes stop_codon:yes gene_type:complete
MNISIPFKIINNTNIYFHEPIKNTVINDSYFIRILYTNKYIITNGIHIIFTYNEFNQNLINNNIELEKNILNLYNSNTKHFYKIEEILTSYKNNLKENFENKKSKLILKISGIWENNSGIGITCKIIII